MSRGWNYELLSNALPLLIHKKNGLSGNNFGQKIVKIQRVLEYGEMQDWRLINKIYGLPKIVEVCKGLRTLDPVCLSFICAISHTKKEDYRCYRIRQSNPTLWNS